MPLWVVLSAALAMGLGTASGGWRIVKTMGLKVVELKPIDGFAAETAAATVIEVAARNQLLKLQGHHSAREFQERLNRAIAEARPEAGFDMDAIE